MNKVKTAELIFGLVIIGLIYIVISDNVTITGNVINTPGLLKLVSPKDNAEIKQGEYSFIFGYDAGIEMSSCTLMIDDKPAKIINSLMSSSGTRMKVTLEPGTYLWSVSCIDILEQEYQSATQKIIILQPANQDGFVKTSFFDKPGNLYEFEISQSLDIMLGNIISGDVLLAKKGNNQYYVSIAMISQDYSTNTEFADFIVTPGNKRIHLLKSQSTSIDFNNDQVDDIIIGLKDISFREATISVKSSSLISKLNEETGKQSEIEAPTININQEPVREIEQQKPAEIKEMPERMPNQNNKAYMIVNYIVLIVIIFLIAGIIILKRKQKDRAKAAATSSAIKEKQLAQNKKPRSKIRKKR